MCQNGTRTVGRTWNSKKKKWIREWITRREKLGASTNLLRELAAEDPTGYMNGLRISSVKFEELLDIITPEIKKKTR